MLGNAVTACRWAAILTELGHQVAIATGYDGAPNDLLIALHANRSRKAIDRFRELYPNRPVVIGLAGTDLYPDISSSPEAIGPLEHATRLVLLQPKGLSELPRHLREKARVIYQSAAMLDREVSKPEEEFRVCVLAHLRDVKDPLRAAQATRLLPSGSRVRVVHAGRALTDAAADEAREELQANPRYRWLGELSHQKGRALLAGSHLMVISSKSEGGANVISEALAASVPILASRIPGNIGILGEDYPGYFSVGSTQELAKLLERAESDTGYYRRLTDSCQRVASLADPAGEREAWSQLLEELTRPRVI